MSILLYMLIYFYILRHKYRNKNQSTTIMTRNVSVQKGASIIFSAVKHESIRWYEMFQMLSIISDFSPLAVEHLSTIVVEYINLCCYLPDMFIPLTFLLFSKDLRPSFCKKKRLFTQVTISSGKMWSEKNIDLILFE